MSTAVTSESNLEMVLKDMKDSYEAKIVDPNEKPGDYIRSQNLIKKLHTYIADEFIKYGIDKSRVREEVKLYGQLKYKDQDICIFPEEYEGEEVDIIWGEEKYLGKKCKSDDIVECILSINVRSQLSSLMKNKDTLLERTFAEALNFHLRCPRMCLGEVYLIPVYEYDNDEFENNKVEFIKTSIYGLEVFKDLEEDKLLELEGIQACKNIENRDVFITKLNEFNIIPELNELYLEEKIILSNYNVKIFKLGKNPSEERSNDYNRFKVIRKELSSKISKLKLDISKVVSIRARIERYINFFDEINMRNNIDSDYHKYEKCTLLIVDFSQEQPVLYRTTQELKNYGLVGPMFNTELGNMKIDDFAPDLISIYNERFI